jgi:uncharacterized protein (UPF0332 family)
MNRQQKDFALYSIETAHKRLREAAYLIDGGFYNSSIRASYYAIFDISKGLLNLKGIKTESHDRVKVMLSKEFIRAKMLPADFAKKFTQLKALREDADYEEYIEFTQVDALEAYNEACDYVGYCKNLIKEILKESESRL